MQRALVIRTYGNQSLALPIANAMESQEHKRIMEMESKKLRDLEARLGTKEFAQGTKYSKKIRAVRRKYHVEPMTGFRKKYWQFIGLVVLLFKGEVEA